MMSMKSPRLIILTFLPFLLLVVQISSFNLNLHQSSGAVNSAVKTRIDTRIATRIATSSSSTVLHAGFGKPSELPPNVKLSNDAVTNAFLKMLPPSQTKSTSLASIPPLNYRGVIATKPIKKGTPIISIPYTLAVDLGTESLDPIPPALHLKSLIESSAVDKRYVSVLPSSTSPDYSNLYSSWPSTSRSSLNWCHLESSRESFIERLPEPEDMYYVFLVTSRVLTVQDPEGRGRKLLIPYLDMCNHDEKSTHVLTGVAGEGGMLKVVAGKDVKVGEEITIRYGGGEEGVDEFLRDYGFDPGERGGYERFGRRVAREVKMGLNSRGGLREEERRQIRESLKVPGGGEVIEKIKREVGKVLDEIDGW
ncbi:hypothetical protein TrST_g8274 [Triparma strigata]|uniref:SET domain-containing protein n=1 Tax=Triparma strigata TaxID=1606541 RepID=A0A9W7DWA1_9STRA|nr:hypothetical protein TrST_g8274 [Triparma strigata]